MLKSLVSSTIMGETFVRDQIEEIVKQAEGTQVVLLGQAPATGHLAVAQSLIPYINVFDSAHEEQRTLLSTLQSRMELLKNSIEQDSGELHSRVHTMGHAFGNLFNTFKELNEAYERSQAIVARSGQMIETLHRVKKGSNKAKDLLSVFLDINNGRPTGKLDGMLESTISEDRKRGARMMRRLKILAESGIPGTESGSKKILEMCLKYEEGLLGDFHRAFEDNNMMLMREVAALLTRFNGGTSSVDSFVSQHSFFLEPVDDLLIVTQYHPSKVIVPLDLTEPPTADPILVKFFEQVALTADADWKYLEEVFEMPVMVMDHLMQRIFREPMTQYMKEVLKQAKGHSMLAYLRSLFACHQGTKNLLQLIKASYYKHVKEGASRHNLTKAQVDDAQGQADQMLNSLMGEVFAACLQVSSLQGSEYQVLTDLLTLATSPLQGYMQAKKIQSGSGGLSSVFANLTTSSSSNAGTPTSDLATRASLYTFEGGVPLVRLEDGSDGVISKVVIRNCLVLHAEGAVRLFAMLPAEERGAALEGYLEVLLRILFEQYIEVSIDSCLHWSDDVSTNNGVDVLSFRVVQSSCLGLSIVLKYCQDTFLSLIVAASTTAYRNMVQSKTEAAARVTGKIDALLRKLLDSSMKVLADILVTKQRKSDYKPRGDDLEALVGPTKACIAVCEYVGKVSKAAITYLDKVNVVTFLGELGSSLHILLLNHLKSLSITDTGAMVLQTDLKRYQGLVQVMKPAESLLNDRYEMLWEVGHLYLVRPENLRTLLLEGHLARVDAKLLYPFIAGRADFSSTKMAQLFPEIDQSSFTRLFSM